jgi:hypothetical protein
MAKTIQTQYTLYLPPETAVRFERFVAESRIPKSVLFREAVEDLLAKHKVCAPSKSRRSKS